MSPRTLAALALLFGVGLALDAPVTASLLAGRVHESPPERAPSAASVVAIKSMQLGLFSRNDDQKGAA